MKDWKTRFPTAHSKAILTFRTGAEVSQQAAHFEIGLRNTILHYEQISPRKVMVIYELAKTENHAV